MHTRHTAGGSTETSPRSLESFHFPAGSASVHLPFIPSTGRGSTPPGQPDPGGRFTRSVWQIYPIRWAAPHGRSCLPPARSSSPTGILLSACGSLLFREFLSSLSGAEGGIKGTKDQTCDPASTQLLKEGEEGEMAGAGHRTPGRGRFLKAGSGVNPEPQESPRGGGGCAAGAPRSFLLRKRWDSLSCPPALSSRRVTSARCPLCPMSLLPGVPPAPAPLGHCPPPLRSAGCSGPFASLPREEGHRGPANSSRKCHRVTSRFLMCVSPVTGKSCPTPRTFCCRDNMGEGGKEPSLQGNSNAQNKQHNHAPQLGPCSDFLETVSVRSKILQERSHKQGIVILGP
ncbi:uncharacterized protein LOC131572610 [Poecile atricapillus]|uniref:uncharacterized protein LOC131572610 n=1 Tax=Poecile atricapillus TaxID=48891 RepID=UPI0027388954|nr:uncharacterized protein LOC131572610 [Poecile atricapillus]